MKNLSFVVLAAVLLSAMMAQPVRPVDPETVEIPSGSLRLKAFLWKPTGAGPFPAVMFNHGRSNTPQQHTSKLTITSAAQVLGPVFVKHGYVLLFPFRRGEGLSANQGPFIGDLLQREEAARGEDGRNRLQLGLMTPHHLDDPSAALTFLKRLAYV